MAILAAAASSAAKTNIDTTIPESVSCSNGPLSPIKPMSLTRTVSGVPLYTSINWVEIFGEKQCKQYGLNPTVKGWFHFIEEAALMGQSAAIGFELSDHSKNFLSYDRDDYPYFLGIYDMIYGSQTSDKLKCKQVVLLPTDESRVKFLDQGITPHSFEVPTTFQEFVPPELLMHKSSPKLIPSSSTSVQPFNFPEVPLPDNVDTNRRWIPFPSVGSEAYRFIEKHNFLPFTGSLRKGQLFLFLCITFLISYYIIFNVLQI